MAREDTIDRLRLIVRKTQAYVSFHQPTDLRLVRVEAAAILAALLGADHYVVGRLDALTIPSGGTGLGLLVTEIEVAEEFLGLVQAGFRLVEDAPDGVPTPVSPDLCDPELWEHIEKLVASNDWGHVPSAVATFVEHWFRERAGNPPNKAGGKLVGKDLFAHALGESSPLRLGTQSSEHQGWMNLGMGLIAAVGNVHRHTVGRRTDAEKYAWRVIGLASLLLGEMKRTHPES